MIEVKCEVCGEPFDKPKKEVNRCKKLGMKHCCSRSCAVSYRNGKMTDEYWKEQYEKQKKTFDIKSQCGNLRDEYSPFRFFLNKGKSSIIKHKNEINIDEKYLKELWEKQNGICPYTGIKMILPASTHKSQSIKSLKRASLDRIDSTKGYLKDNVEFVCLGVNLAKCNFTKKEAISFFKEIASS